VFVAGFIGSPAMNFLPGKVTGAGEITLDSGGVARGVRVAAEIERAVTVGIRPEHLRVSDATQAFVSGPVEMVEQLGADALVHIGQQGAAVVARVPHGMHPDAGTRFSAAVTPDRVFVFDSQTGRRL